MQGRTAQDVPCKWLWIGVIGIASLIILTQQCTIGFAFIPIAAYFFSGKKFEKLDGVQNAISKYFAQKTIDFL